jgi:hypothetical protein
MNNLHWENEHFKYFGHKAGDLKRAARKQHAPETCWATCLAMAAALLGVQDWDNELKWFRAAKAAELTESSGRITEQNFVTLAGGIKAPDRSRGASKPDVLCPRSIFRGSGIMATR